MSAASKDGLFAVCGSFIGLSTITVALRFYARKHQALPLGPDDWLSLFGVVTFIGAAAVAIEVAKIGAGGYAHLTPEEAARTAMLGTQLFLSYDFLSMNTLACAKLSAIFLYRRAFRVPGGNTAFMSLLWTTVAIVAAWYIVFDFLSLYQCRTHFTALWDGQYEKYCDLGPVWAQGLAISDFLLDIWVLLLPIPQIWRLHTSLAKKFSIIGVFLLAGIGLGASAARIVLFFDSGKIPDTATLYIGMLEAGITITVVNLPSIYYLCTSTLVDGVARSLRSLHSLHSLGSQRSAQEQSITMENTVTQFSTEALKGSKAHGESFGSFSEGYSQTGHDLEGCKTYGRDM